MIRVSLPFPVKVLWPNGRTRSVKWKAVETAKHKRWAWLQTPVATGFTAPIPVNLTVYPEAKGPFPDADNCVAACKAYLDGIALRLGINDRDFAAPTVAFGPREARIEITVGPRDGEPT